MKKSILPNSSHQRPVRLRAAGNDGDVEAVLGISAVRHGLKEAARLGVGEPVRRKLHLVERHGRLGQADPSRQGREHRQPHPTRSAFIAPRNADVARSKALESGAPPPGSTVVPRAASPFWEI